SPVVWGDQVFVTTAVSSAETTDFGTASPMSSAEDVSSHRWEIHALDAETGEVRWSRVAYEGEPRTKRSPKNSYASETPAVDAERVVAFFGSHGLSAWSHDGEPLWSRDLGTIDSGFFFDPDYQWGTASSPILWRDLVIVQADGQEESFVAAFDAATGEPRWRTDRDEVPSWSTPLLWDVDPPQLIANGVRAVRAYDPATGELLWELPTDNSVIAAATPVANEELAIVGSGYRPLRPLYAVRPSARGDIGLGPDAQSNAGVAWSSKSVGPYYITPLIHGDQLYVLYESGVFSSFYLLTGERIYRTRVGSGATFSASPVVAGDRLYLASENGSVYVGVLGLEWVLLETNPGPEPFMATPAVVGDTIYLRGRHHLWAVREPEPDGP
ncbi:MAG: PQQ-binding-like beta-propeller repeat protein, partial [Acidobacteriota bacterium]